MLLTLNLITEYGTELRGEPSHLIIQAVMQFNGLNLYLILLMILWRSYGHKRAAMWVV